MSEYDDIRPYNDDEVRPTLELLLADTEFLDNVARLKLPKSAGFMSKVLRPMVRKRLAEEVANVHTVVEFQALVEKYLGQQLNKTVSKLSFSGLDKLSCESAYLFMSNHRDIAMDPAFTNWGLYHNGFSTLRIAIGDNLLTKPFASKLMRLNKCFIVKRSLSVAREKFKAAKVLSSYIHHSVLNDNENVWIAQREGRAKDGLDATNPAIINMLALSKGKGREFADFIREARLVPVSISYEIDPCDQAKARELYEKNVQGSYTKEQHEDVESIARGITGFKGDVHVSFGEPLGAGIVDAEAAAAEIDRQVEANYVLHPSNCFAYEMLEKRSPKVLVGADHTPFDGADWSEKRSSFKAHIASCNEKWKSVLLTGYANPVYRRLEEK